MKEAILLVICVHLTTSILSQVVELIHILHYRPAPLTQLHELGHLLVDNTSRYEELAEGGGELLPRCRVIRQLRGQESLPPGTCGPQKLLGRKSAPSARWPLRAAETSAPACEASAPPPTDRPTA